MSRFLRIFAIIFSLFFVGNAFAAGYTCASYKKYTSCEPGYYMVNSSGTYNGTPVAGNSCRICEPGYYCPGGTQNRQQCATGSYSSGTGNTACTACQNGTTTSGTGKTSCDATCSNNNDYDNTWKTATWSANSLTNLCTINNCKAGSKYASASGGSCTACSAGSYMASSAHTTTSCTSAEKGYYVSGTGKTSQSKCSAGTYTDATGKSSCSNITAGCYGGEGSISSCPTVCGNNTYSNAGASSCTSCDSDYANSGTTAAAHAGVASCKVTCAAGKYVASANAACTDVGDGYYRSGTETVSQGNTGSRNACTSLNAFYKKSDSGRDANTDCYGTTTAGNFIKTAKSGQVTCDAGGYCPGSSKVYYNSTGGRTGCSGGTYNANTGSSAASACVACATGSYSSGTGNTACTACQNGTTTSGTGKTSCDATCSNNNDYDNTWKTATWSANSLTNLCTINNCKAGSKYASASGGSCTACSAGSYMASSAHTTTSCTSAEKGYYVSGTGKTSQSKCSAGTYTDATGKSSCSNITAGCYGGEGSISSCPTVCGNNTYSNAGASSCTSCDSDYANSGTTAAAHAGVASCKVTCAAGKYVASANAACTDVGDGYYRSGTETVSQGNTGSRNACTSLNAFYKKSDSGRDANTDCYGTTTAGNFIKTAKSGQVTCDAGGYCPGSSKVYYNSTGGRTGCSGGTYNANTGSSAASACVACATGSYSSGTGNTACTACQNGTTTSGTGKTSCDATCSNNNDYDNTWKTATWSANSLTNLCTINNCKAGSKYASASGGSCTACSAGSYMASSAHTTTSCTSAEKGYYVSGTGKTSQSKCSAGTYTDATGKSSCSNITAGCYGGEGSISSCPTVCGNNTYSNAGASSCTSCDSDYANSGTTAAAHAGVASCKVTCAAGKYVASANAACTDVGDGYYRSGTQTVSQGSTGSRNACTSLNAFYKKSDSGRDANTDCYGTTTAGKYVKTAKSGEETCAINSQCTGGVKVYYAQIGGNELCPADTFSASGSVSCTACPEFDAYGARFVNIRSAGQGCFTSMVFGNVNAPNNTSAMNVFIGDGSLYKENPSYDPNNEINQSGVYFVPALDFDPVNLSYAGGNFIMAGCNAGYYDVANGQPATWRATLSDNPLASIKEKMCQPVTGGKWSAGITKTDWSNQFAGVTQENMGIVIAGDIEAGYYSTGGGTSATPTAAGNGCISGKSCGTIAAGRYGAAGATTAQGSGAVSAGYYSTGGGTSATPTAAGNGCLSSKSCGPIAAGRYGAAGATASTGSGAVSAGYYSTGGGTSATPTAAGNGCISSKSCGPIAAGRYGAAGATTDQGSGAVNAGYYSTGGGTSATPTAAGNGCISGKECGKITANCYAGAGSTSSCPNECPGDMTSDAGSDAKTDCKITCSAGNYLAANTSACTTCTKGNYCANDGTYNFNASSDQGISACSGTNQWQANTGKTSCNSVTDGKYKSNNYTLQDCGTGYYCKSGARSQCPNSGTTANTTASVIGSCYKTGLSLTVSNGTGTQRCYYTSGSGSSAVYSSSCDTKTVTACNEKYYYVSGTDCTSVGTGYYSGANSLGRTQCPTADSGWTVTSPAGSAYGDCYETKTGSAISSYCNKGVLKRTASSATAYSSTITIPTALEAKPGSIVNGQTCEQCSGAVFSGGGTATSCTACPAQTSGWTRATGTGWDSYTDCYQTKAATAVSNYCYSGQLKQVGASATTWATATVSTAFTADKGSYVKGTGANTTCEQCACGTYQGTDGSTATSCTTTTAGYYATGTGNSTQTQAEAGYYAAAGACSQTVLNNGCYGSAGASDACPNSCSRLGSFDMDGSKLTYSSLTPRNANTQCRVTARDGETRDGCSTIVSNTLSYNGTTYAGDLYTAKASKGYRVSSANGITPSCTICAAGTYQSSDDSTATSCTACTGRTKYSGTGASSCSTVSTGYYSTGCNSSGNNCTAQSQCSGSTYCVNGVQNSCPTAEANWTQGTGNGWSAVTSCFETRNATNISDYCSAGQLKKNATSATAWGSSTISTALKARAGSIVNGQTCEQCSGAVFSGGGTATSCTACPAQTSGWTRATGTGWDSYTDCYQTKAATAVSNYCYSGQLKQVGASATTWATATVSTAFTADKGSYVSGTGANTTCEQCAAGTYQGTDGSTATSCTNAEDGKYVASTGASSSTACATGSYSEKSSASTKCIACPKGRTTSGTGTKYNATANTACSVDCLNATGAYAWEDPSWSANSVTNLCTISTCDANTYYTATTGTGYKNTCSTCGTNSTTSAGNTSKTCACNAGYTADGKVGGTATTTSAACQLISDIACAVGQYVPAKATSCSACTAGYYCPSSAKTYSWSSSIQGRTECAPGTYQPNTGKTSCLSADAGYYVPSKGQTKQTACSGATYQTSTGQSACITCPTAQNLPSGVTVKNYGYWISGDIHTERSGCSVYFNSIDIEDGVLGSAYCYIDEDANSYGMTGTSKNGCYVRRENLTCDGGYYNKTFADSSTATQLNTGKTLATAKEKACTDVESGYWSANNSLTRTACETGLVTCGSGTCANEAADCGRKLHMGDNTIYLRSVKRTTPSLNVKVGDKTFYGALSTSLSSKAKVKNSGTTYSVVNDYQ